MEVAAFHPSALGRGLVSVALFVTSPCQGVTLHPALRSPDFPLCRRELPAHSGCLADSRTRFYPARAQEYAFSMRRRLYFLLPDVESARHTADDLLLARVEDRHMHFLATPKRWPAAWHRATRRFRRRAGNSACRRRTPAARFQAAIPGTRRWGPAPARAA